MSEPVTVTITQSAWLHNGYGCNPNDLIDALARGDTKALSRMLHYYGGPDQEKFGDYTKVGTAEVTIQFLPRDEQVRLAVAALNEKLNKARSEWLTTQQQIMEQINKLQALDYVEAA